ncbi:transketolase C-terminal domain-containing protein [Marinitoga lauensis]|uniref:transketolase C-terminal domain-containing protein n=1 Tax=Marinitoga lauensis TaxID=2201189 RepID=UPI0010112163|nr:transketolase C-terminal domain-containing protein [Marinitoga lauensis]
MEELDATIIGVRNVKNIDKHILQLYLKDNTNIITVEENSLKGGFNEEIKSYILENKIKCSLHTFGIKDEFVPQGIRHELLNEFVVKPVEIKKLLYSTEKIK